MEAKTIVTIVLSLSIGFLGGYYLRDSYPKDTAADKPSFVVYKPNRETQESAAYPRINTAEKRVDEDYVERVVDGDTLVLRNGIYVKTNRVRLLGLNTPELNKNKKKEPEPYAAEASKKLEDLVVGKKIILEKDTSKEMDSFSRALRYVIIDDRCVNVEIIMEGYGRAFMYKDLKREKDILDAEEEAKKSKKGIWK